MFHSVIFVFLQLNLCPDLSMHLRAESPIQISETWRRGEGEREVR